MRKRVFIFVALFLAFAFGAVFAAGHGRPAASHVDKNKDGVVDRKEIQMEKSEVNTPWERRLDTDKDGIVEKNEVANNKEGMDLNNDGIVDRVERRRAWLHSRAKVDTSLEAKYDTNADG